MQDYCSSCPAEDHGDLTAACLTAMKQAARLCTRLLSVSPLLWRRASRSFIYDMLMKGGHYHG